MANSSSEIQEEVRVDHQHSYTYVYPSPADVAKRKGEFPYMLCGCGDKAKIIQNDQRWHVINGEWKYATTDEYD